MLSMVNYTKQPNLQVTALRYIQTYILSKDCGLLLSLTCLSLDWSGTLLSMFVKLIFFIADAK
jgi:hypothetical protein